MSMGGDQSRNESETRPLSRREREILDLLLSAEFQGVEALRVQGQSVTAQGTGLIIELVPRPDLPLATVTSRTPVTAVVEGEGFDGGLLIFVDEGRLSALEYWWVTDEMPETFPPLSAVGTPVADR